MKLEHCPDEAAVQAFIEGKLASDDAKALREHLDGCDDCRRWVANAADALLSEPGAEAARTTAAGGDTIGRYVVLGVVGQGGMGTVFAAWDPQLDRKVALKLVRFDHLRDGTGDHRAASERMAREAQALARLNHPNVVAVYDVGTVDDELFIAMEFVEGMSLRAWLQAEPRGWRAIVRVFVAAGAGLAAAHEAGLVHRDFKPDNAIVGVDGRVRVVDFGLARAGSELAVLGTSDATTTSVSLLAPAGTPAYMAPEQRLGEAVDGRADQFALCRALLDALTDDRTAPRWLVTAAERGLRPEPRDRWPDMAALIAAIDRDPARRLRRIAATLGLAGAAVVATAVLRGDGDPCPAQPDALVGAWDPEIEAGVRTTLQPIDDDGETTRATLDVLTTYASAWEAMRTEACVAHRVHGEQSAALFDQRMECLGRRRAALAGFTAALTEPGALTLGEVLPTVEALPSVADCADVEVLRSALPMPSDPLVREALDAGERDLRRAWSRRYMFGETTALIPTTESIVAVAQANGWPPLEADARSLLADLHTSAGDFAAAERELTAGLRAAAMGRHDRTAGLLAIKLTALLGIDQLRFAEAEIAARQAEAWLLRAESSEQDLAGLASVEAVLARLQGDPARARALQERSIAWLDASAEATGAERAGERANYAATLIDLEEYDAARRVLEEALEIAIPELGETHPVIGVLVQNQGAVAEAENDGPGMVAAAIRCGEIHAAAYGPRHFRVGDCLDNRAVGELTLGHLHDAHTHATLAVEILAEALGPDHAEVGDALLTLARVDAARGDCAARAIHLQRSIANAEAVLGADAEHTRQRRAEAAEPCAEVAPPLADDITRGARPSR